jgi:hypothetical protein
LAEMRSQNGREDRKLSGHLVLQHGPKDEPAPNMHPAA